MKQQIKNSGFENIGNLNEEQMRRIYGGAFEVEPPPPPPPFD